MKAWWGILGVVVSGVQAAPSLTWYDMGWHTVPGREFRYKVNLNWTQQYRTPNEELLMAEHTSITDLKAVLRFEVKEVNEKEGEIALKAHFEKLEGTRNGVTLSLDALDRMTDLETLMGLVFNKIGLILPWDPAEVGSRWVRTVPMMDPLGEGIGQADRKHLGATMDIVISRKGYILQDRQGGPPQPPKAPEGSKKFEVRWTGNEVWKGLPVAVMVTEMETPPTEIERHGQAMTLSSRGRSEVKFSWPRGQPVSATYEENGRIRYPGAISEVLAEMTVELDGPPPLHEGGSVLFPSESLYPVESKRLTRLKADLEEARSVEDFEQVVRGFEEWRGMNRAGPAGVSLGASVVSDQAWWRLMEPLMPSSALEGLVERNRDQALVALSRAKGRESAGELEGLSEEWLAPDAREWALRLSAQEKADGGEIRASRWLVPRSKDLPKPLWSLEWPKPIAGDPRRLTIAKSRHGLVCVESSAIQIIDEARGSVISRSAWEGNGLIGGERTFRLGREGEILVFDEGDKGWRVTPWLPPSSSEVRERPVNLPFAHDAASPLHVLEGTPQDQGVYFLSARTGAAQQLVLYGWDVDRRAPRCEGQWLWGVKLQEGPLQQAVGVKAALHEPWLAGLGSDGTAFVVHAMTGKFQWMRKLVADRAEEAWKGDPRLAVGEKGAVFVLPALGRMEGVELASGKPLWVLEAPKEIVGLSMTEDEIILAGPREIIAVRIRDGFKRTVYEGQDRCRGMAVLGRHLGVVEGDRLVIVEIASGAVVRTLPLEGHEGWCELFPVSDRLYVVSSKRLTAFSR